METQVTNTLNTDNEILNNTGNKEQPKYQFHMIGWICPKCGGVYSPWTSCCPKCTPPMDMKITC